MFDTDYNITGSHATKLKSLAVKNSEDKKDVKDTPKVSARIFERYIDVYLNAAVWGLLYNRTSKRDTSSSDRARIYADAFSRERDNCMFLYRMVMLLANSDRKNYLTKEQRVDRAFRYDSKGKEFLEENLELFHSYVRGGIDILYETFCEKLPSFTREDFMNRIHDTLSEYKNNLEKNNGEFVPEDKNIDKDFEDKINILLKE